MGKYSRTEKYQELREHLQNDSEGQIDSKELSAFTERLNKIDSSQLGTIPSHEPSSYKNSVFGASFEEEEVSTFNNEYLDEYISEVKQYNREKGRMLNEDTQINILKELRGDKPEVPTFDDTIVMEEITFDFASKNAETMDIPFLKEDTKMNTQISSELSKMLNEELDEYSDYEIIDDASDYVNESDEDDDDEDYVQMPFNFAKKLKEEETQRLQLMEETTKMRTQLDNYRGNLDQMEERVNSSNRILNFILIVLIFALLVVIGIVGYWVLLNRGII